MDSKSSRFKFSLRTLLLVVLTAGLLFGLTFKTHSGSVSYGQRWLEQFRGETSQPEKRLCGSISNLGFPFSNYKVGETWVLSNWETTVRSHEHLVISGVVFNLVFWFLFSCGLWYLIGRTFRSRRAFQP